MLLTKLPGLNFQVINITNVFVIVVLFGAGTDYCLFLIARYREEVVRGRSRGRRLARSDHPGRGALVASAGTVIVGLGMLWYSSFAKIQYTGPAIALSLAIALVAAPSLAPVLLHWLRAAVFWPFRQPHHTQGADREQETIEQVPLSNSVTERLKASGVQSTPAPATAPAPAPAASSSAKVQGKPAPAPAIVRTGLPRGPSAFAIFIERAGALVRAVPVLGAKLASIPGLLDLSAQDGRSASTFGLLLRCSPPRPRSQPRPS